MIDTALQKDGMTAIDLTQIVPELFGTMVLSQYHCPEQFSGASCLMFIAHSMPHIILLSIYYPGRIVNRECPPPRPPLVSLTSHIYLFVSTKPSSRTNSTDRFCSPMTNTAGKEQHSTNSKTTRLKAKSSKPSNQAGLGSFTTDGAISPEIGLSESMTSDTLHVLGDVLICWEGLAAFSYGPGWIKLVHDTSPISPHLCRLQRCLKS